MFEVKGNLQRKKKSKTFLFIISFVTFIVLVVMVSTLKEVILFARANQQVEFYYGEIIRQEVKNPPYEGAKPDYHFIIE